MNMQKRKRSFTLIVAGILCLAFWAAAPGLSEAAGKGEAAGSLAIDGKSVRLVNVYAMDQPNTFDKKKSDIAVMITEKALEDEAFRDLEDLLDTSRSLKGTAWVYFKINSEEKPIYEMVSHPTLGESTLMMSGFTRADFIKQVLTGKKIEGTFRTKQKEDFMGHFYELDVKFNAEITRAKRPEPLPDAKSGKALPANGGEPYKAYKALHTALINKDIAQFRKLAPESGKTKDLTDKEIAEGMEFMALMIPHDPTLTKGYISKSGDRAVLYLTGMVENEKNYGTIEMLKKADQWRTVKEGWSNTPPGK
ncbi:MAG: hypothetical protein EPN25_13875 [Nitrospirae bacterium]|nr:MAG: hypothetical protein EPN25_13875 [Nitrospirota bacterium]